MLIEFKLRNFRSFCSEQSFQFPGLSSRKLENYRVAVIFGASGAGKTNLILGLATLRNLVLNSATYTERQYCEQYAPFQIGSAPGTPTNFEIEVQLDHTRYRYTLSYDAQRVWFERLLVYRTGKPQRWFERHFDPATQSDQWAAFSPSFNGTRELWRRMTRPKALFLTTAARLECEQLQPFVRWFEHSLGIWFAREPVDLGGIAASVRDPIVKHRMLTLLRAVDVPVQDIRLADGAPPADTMVHGAEGHRIELRYEQPDGGQVWLDSADEARGTLRLLSLLGPLLPALEQGTLMVVDEFDAGLHPLVARYLIQFAKHSPTSHATVQLLMSSHDVALMVPEILEHDEVWLMERDADRCSRLLPISVRGPRKGERLARGYLRGRYGGVPAIRSGSCLTHAPTDETYEDYVTQRSA